MRFYGLCIAIGIALAVLLTSRELDRKGYDSSLAIDSLFIVLPLGLIGARAYHVLTDYELYKNDPIPGIFEIWNGGLGIYGAVIGGFLGLLIFARIRGVDPLILADAAAPGLVLAQAVGRWGNYFNQELFGRPSDLPWAIEIAPQNRPPGFKDAVAFHPTFLYESLWDILVCLILLFVARRFARSLKNGDIVLLYVSLYSLGRFFVETLRIDPAFPIGGFRGNLLVASVLALVFALILFLRHAGTTGRGSAGKRASS